MKREPVTSSNLLAVGHDPKTKTLEVEFQSGRVYTYAGVSAQRKTALLKAPSLGSYFHKNVRTSYPFKRLK